MYSAEPHIAQTDFAHLHKHAGMSVFHSQTIREMLNYRIIPLLTIQMRIV